MLRMTYWSGLFAMFAVSLALAQDPTKVESSHYRVAFSNENVEAISIHYGPHEKSGLHEHPGGVVVSITKAHLRLTDQNGKVQEVWAEPGEARWFPPLKHRVENLGDTPYNAVYIVIKNRAVAHTKDGAPVLDADQQNEAKAIVASLSR